MSSPYNTIVLDLETARSADDCRYCGHIHSAHFTVEGEDGFRCPGRGEYGSPVTHYEGIGWDNKPALGLSVGCYYDYDDQRVHWFDKHTLVETMTTLVQRQALLVSYNGIAFDFPLMRGLVRRQAEALEEAGRAHNNGPSNRAIELVMLCDAFKVLCATSYDILAGIWKVAPASKFVRGLNSLDAIAQANGLGGKTGHGAQAPRDWAAGRWAQTLNYCSNDVYLTKALFDMLLDGAPLVRSDGVVLALRPPLPQSILGIDYYLEAL